VKILTVLKEWWTRLDVVGEDHGIESDFGLPPDDGEGMKSEDSTGQDQDGRPPG
jgi:hypothetical protein